METVSPFARVITFAQFTRFFLFPAKSLQSLTPFMIHVNPWDLCGPARWARPYCDEWGRSAYSHPQTFVETLWSGTGVSTTTTCTFPGGGGALPLKRCAGMLCRIDPLF